MQDAEKTRIQAELKAVGYTRYGLIKAESRHLSTIIHKNEHIGGAIYGRSKNGSLMVIATNKRLLFLDHKLLFRLNDELSYDVLSGVSYNAQGRYAGVIVHTRNGDYALKFVNRRAAKIFIEFVEKRRIENTTGQPYNIPTLIVDRPGSVTIDREVVLFLLAHNLGVLSTVDGHGQVSGAAVYYALSGDNVIYIVTKAGTRKFKNISQHPEVAFTVYDGDSMQTLQLQGTAHVEQGDHIKRDILQKVIQPRIHGKETAWPPITKLAAGDYAVIKIMPTDLQYFDYKK